MYLGYQKGRIVCVGDSEHEVCNFNGVEIDCVKYSSENYVLYDGEYVKTEEAQKKIDNLKIKNKINELKEFLFDTDYVVLKVFEGVSSFEDYKEIFEKRQLCRNQINELEKQS